jgi:hypothetical protein
MAKFSTDSKYLKHQDLDGRDVVLTIKSYQREVLKGKDGKEQRKWCIYFKETDPATGEPYKALALNATNGAMIIKNLGSEDMDDWIDKKITVYEKDDVEMGGEIKSGIRIRPRKAKPAPEPEPEYEEPTEEERGE